MAMKLFDIARMPVCIDEIPLGCRGVHESVLRSYQILELVKEWLAAGVPARVILDVAKELKEYVEP